MMHRTHVARPSKRRISRRRFGMELLALTAGASVSNAAPGRPIDELRLPPELLAELERQAEPVLRQAEMLAELPLKDVPPAFHFHPLRHAWPL
jgi:hypothetical protein